MDKKSKSNLLSYCMRPYFYIAASFLLSSPSFICQTSALQFCLPVAQNLIQNVKQYVNPLKRASFQQGVQNFFHTSSAGLTRQHFKFLLKNKTVLRFKNLSEHLQTMIDTEKNRLSTYSGLSSEDQKKYREQWKWTDLHVQIAENNFLTLHEQLKGAIDLPQDDLACSPLHLALLQNEEEFLKLLDVSTAFAEKDSFYSLVLFSLFLDKPKVEEQLIEKGYSFTLPPEFLTQDIMQKEIFTKEEIRLLNTQTESCSAMHSFKQTHQWVEQKYVEVSKNPKVSALYASLALTAWCIIYPMLRWVIRLYLQAFAWAFKTAKAILKGIVYSWILLAPFLCLAILIG